MVFDRGVSWSKNMGIVAWVAVCSRNSKLKDWLAMQCIKGSSTLRISSKDKKPAPKVVFRFGKQDRQVKKFLETRKFILNFLKRLKKCVK
jgi:hypothetical protein